MREGRWVRGATSGKANGAPPNYVACRREAPAFSSGARCSIRPCCGAASARIVGAKPRHWGRIDHSIRVGTPR